MKKRIIVPMLVFAMLLSLCACNGESTKQKSLLHHGLDVVATMDEMANSEAYLNFYTADKEMTELVKSIGKDDHSTPVAVYQITMDNAAGEIWDRFGGLEGLSDNLKTAMRQKAFGAAMITQINAQSGATALAASAVCTAGKTFVCEDAAEDCIYLYVYENACPAAVSFVCGEDYSVSAAGTFILNDAFDTGTTEILETFFAERGANIEAIPFSK